VRRGLGSIAKSWGNGRNGRKIWKNLQSHVFVCGNVGKAYGIKHMDKNMENYPGKRSQTVWGEWQDNVLYLL